MTLWITEGDVVSLMHLGEAISSLEEGLKLEAAGEAANMVKTHAVWGGHNTLHAIGATFEGAGFVGTKTWGHTSGGATPLLILWDSVSGELKAVIEAFALGQMRTGAMSGVATRWLAEASAHDMAVIGTGKQALTQVAAVAAVRPLRRVRVFSPNPEHRAAFADKLNAEGFAFEAEVSSSVEAAVDGASIITTVTRATEAFLDAGMIAPGAHVNAVGAITPEREEFAQDLFGRAAVVAADNVAAAKNLSKEYRDYYDSGPGDWADVSPICRVVAAAEGRAEGADLTLFKAMGMGISDLSLGIRLYDAAVKGGVGREVPHPTRAKPRLRGD
jgi:ornithine cyclodeaminase